MIGLNFSRALSPPVRGHCRGYAVPKVVQRVTFLDYDPIHELSDVDLTRRLYGGTHNQVVRETKIHRLCAFDVLDLFRGK
jgi:hypothetical protein